MLWPWRLSRMRRSPWILRTRTPSLGALPTLKEWRDELSRVRDLASTLSSRFKKALRGHRILSVAGVSLRNLEKMLCSRPHKIGYANFMKSFSSDISET